MSGVGALQRLTACLARLPGIGQRTAERMALRLVRQKDTLLGELIAALQEAARDVVLCSRCGGFTSVAQNPCALCTSPSRDGAILCVVEDPNDMVLIERSGGFHGRYHALMGKLSPMRGDGPSDLRLRSLRERIADEGFREVVLALSTDVEGDATASYLADTLRARGVAVTRIAYGLPAGSGVMYSDPLTLSRALKGRQTIEAD